jgi:hypothetical protein
VLQGCFWDAVVDDDMGFDVVDVDDINVRESLHEGSFHRKASLEAKSIHV